MRAFTCTDIHTGILRRLEQTFAHVFITYMPVGPYTNTFTHIVSAKMYISSSYTCTTRDIFECANMSLRCLTFVLNKLFRKLS